MMSGKRVEAADILKNNRGEVAFKKDLVAVEEPLEIRIGFGPERDRRQQNISVTMRTPGSDMELAAGFLFTEGIIRSFDEVLSIKYCRDGKEKAGKENIVRVELQPDLTIDLKKLERHFYTTSSCGVCGKTSIDAVKTNCQAVESSLLLSDEVIQRAPQLLRDKQAVFEYTGGLHASGLFTGSGELAMIREDVGRHNAFDKLIGACLMKNMMPLSEYFILVSGRASFELVQKAAVAGVPVMAAIGAPSSLAVQLAKDMKMTLLGFVKSTGFNIYCGDQRLNMKNYENQD